MKTFALIIAVLVAACGGDKDRNKKDRNTDNKGDSKSAKKAHSRDAPSPPPGKGLLTSAGALDDVLGRKAHAQAGSWVEIGKPVWKNTRSAAIVGGALYTLDIDSTKLWKTELTGGARVALGAADWSGVARFLSTPTTLYAVAKSGELHAVDLATGARKRVGTERPLADMTAGVVLGDHVYSLHTGSKHLHKTELVGGARATLGKPEWESTRWIFGAGGHLYSINSNGGLYKVSPVDGSWVEIGQDRAWHTTRAAVVQGRLYTLEKDDARLWVTDLNTGRYVTIGKAEWDTTVALIAGASSLYAIDTNGSLYRVTM